LHLSARRLCEVQDALYCRGIEDAVSRRRRSLVRPATDATPRAQGTQRA